MAALNADLDRLAGALGTPAENDAVRTLYSRLGTTSFSERILAARPANLAVLPVTGVQWSDWGRPRRVLETLARLGIQPQWAGRVARLG